MRTSPSLCSVLAFPIGFALLACAPLALAQESGGKSAPVIPPITEQASNVVFSGNGAVTLAPFFAPGANPQATPLPECANRRSQMAFRVSCTSDPKQKFTDSCRGSISLFDLGLTQNVSGEISGLEGGPYTMTLHSPDMSIASCALSNTGTVSPDTGNTILMQSCTVKNQQCTWTASGAGGDHALTTSATVSVQPLL